ncbi:Oligopeptide transport ATP-binding protein OppF (TC 3.A.1.5.1) [hydrothermal vent metagenome]|uniref:Oligopeptide transport ATP-binding protein OppF (TC 3.A.1.5.1) n=1 Tax=hydrothermal vent metagenome TaxID=652676 RepID=A0A3B0U3B0_9ZZZZ
MSKDLVLENNQLLLEVKGLSKFFPIRNKGFLRKTTGEVRAVDDVSFSIRQGETLGLVGESGCGKTTTARCIMRAINASGGQILFRQPDGKIVDVASLRHKHLLPLRRQIQMIFQDPYASLNPRMNILNIIGEPLLVAGGMKDREQRIERVSQLLRLVGLRPEYMQRFPHAFSGGQRQRIVIARALALNPSLVVADEPVSALDVSVQAQVLNLMVKLQKEFNLTYLFVAHDLSVVKHICDRVIVMYVGKIVEMAPTNALFTAPRHPYTSALMSAVPEPDPKRRADMVPLEGEVPSPANPPLGCHFHPRCPHAIAVCKTKAPEFRELSPGHMARCHRADELALPGV